MTLVSVGEAAAVDSARQEPVACPRARRLRRLRRLAPAASVAAGTALIGTHGSVYGNWLIDDAAISFAYSRSIAQGLGPVVQAGAEPVEGFSNPTWTVLLALARLVGLFDRGTLFGVPDYVLLPKALALLCCAGILAACYVAAARITRRPWLATIAVGAILAAIPSFVIWTFSGLENSLYALIVGWQAVLVFRAVLDNRLLAWKVALSAGVLAALAALTRPEGLIYAGVYPLVVLGSLRRPLLWQSVRRILLSTAAFAVPVGGYVAWRYATFGQLLSSPSVAKGQDIPALEDMARPGELVEYAGAPAVLVVVALLGMLLAKAPWWRRGLLALLVPLGLALLAYAVLEPDWMSQYRFATPIWVLGALIATLSAIEVFTRIGRRGRAWLSVGLIAALLPSAASFTSHAQEFRTKPNISACYVADRFGRVFNAYADILGLRQASLLIPDLGGSALTSRLRLIDMAGLTHDRFAELARDHDKPGQRDYVYGEARPTFIHIREPWSSGTGLAADPRLERDYHPIHFDIYQGAPHGDWVRKDAVTDDAALARLRSYADTTTTRVEQSGAAWPRRHCGATLRPGQSTIPQP
ncbi:hypothetical protein SacmaDRAFT_3848 [Saccharomonospora marina XMU15]|uniref:Glycosyltransferase RgtA/B/C/D-like domain-containing protein n=1 Tax=Saccharomonospora marina XMU15 TaxID=882083 RepID=H5X1Y2_9PSEU|nr:hypothetical protein [Saccharomonospora marina]EHR52051.1 hypothetical protein SacmaDRAFT_3848 [Saccharomonospora marina XMU15]